mmetsp:Transcript_13702/g.33021  ORF Transcript_13702/g.33021 Transcript_13702/m.33021 type:complete len:200 (-) Transcript_13702:317-916(-)
MSRKPPRFGVPRRRSEIHPLCLFAPKQQSQNRLRIRLPTNPPFLFLFYALMRSDSPSAMALVPYASLRGTPWVARANLVGTCLMPTATMVMSSFRLGSFSSAAMPAGSMYFPSSTAPVNWTSTPDLAQPFCNSLTDLMADAMFSSTNSHAFMPVAHSEMASHLVPSVALTISVFFVTSRCAPSGKSRRNFIMFFTERPW